MRMLKKLLLAGAFIGVLGSFGFAQEAKAADPGVVVTVSGNTINIATVSGNKLVVTAAGVEILNEAVTEAGDSKTFTGDQLKTLFNSKGLTNDSITGKISATLSNTAATWVAKDESKNMPTLYKLSVAVDGTDGSVELDGSTTTLATYDFAGAEHTITAKPNEGYTHYWNDNVSGASRKVTVKTTTSENKYIAKFIMKVTSFRIGAYVNGDSSKVSSASASMKVGDSISFGVLKGYTPTDGKISPYLDIDFTYNSDTYDWYDFLSGDYPTYYAIEKLPSGSIKARGYIEYPDGTSLYSTNTITITISNSSPATSSKITLSDFKDYITEGYTLEFKAKYSDSSINLADANAKLVISDGSDYVNSIDTSTNSSDKNVTFKIKFKDEKLDKGTNSKDVKFKILVGGESGTACPIDSDSETEKKVTVYSNPTNSYNNSDRTMSYKVPAKVNTGTETGKDSNLSYTQDTVSEVKGIRINVLLNDNILGTTTTASGKGTGATVEAATMESIITNLGNSGKFTGDCTVVFRAYPSDGSGNCNKKVYHDTYAKVYKVVLKPGQSATAGAKTASAYALPIAMIAQRNTGATTTTATTATAAGKEYVLYGLEGQTLTAPTGVTDLVDANGNAVTKIVVSADANKNVYTYAATASAATKEGLDKVPKTGQNNVFVYVMAVVVCGAVGYGLYVYNKKSKKSI